MGVDKGIRLARLMGDDQHERGHHYAARLLHAISATSATVPPDMARRWANDERVIAPQLKDLDRHLECIYAAKVLEDLATVIEETP